MRSTHGSCLEMADQGSDLEQKKPQPDACAARLSPLKSGGWVIALNVRVQIERRINVILPQRYEMVG